MADFLKQWGIRYAVQDGIIVRAQIDVASPQMIGNDENIVFLPVIAGAGDIRVAAPRQATIQRARRFALCQRFLSGPQQLGGIP